MLTEDELRLCIFCVDQERQARHHGKPPGPQRWEDKLIGTLCRELVEMSSTRKPLDGDLPHLDHDEHPIGARQVAAMIGCDIRTVQRNAGRLGGRKVGGRLVFRERVIREHIEGTAA